MSVRRSLTFGLRDQLRAPNSDGGLAIPADQCDVMADGRPPPAGGQWFFAVHSQSRRNTWLLGDMSQCQVMVTISRRVDVPFDRLGTDLIDIMDGVSDQADLVWTNVFSHQWTGQYYAGTTGVMQRMNGYLTTGYTWTEAIYPTGDPKVEPVGDDWFSAGIQQSHRGDKNSPNKLPFCGFKIDIQFTGAVIMMNNADAGPQPLFIGDISSPSQTATSITINSNGCGGGSGSGYVYAYRLNSEPWVTGRSFPDIITGLTPSTTYTVQYIGTDAYGNTVLSNVIMVTTSPEVVWATSGKAVVWATSGKAVCWNN